jgi:hypothetical protein
VRDREYRVKRAVPGRPTRARAASERRRRRRPELEAWMFDHHADLVGLLLLITLVAVLFIRFGLR